MSSMTDRCANSTRSSTPDEAISSPASAAWKVALELVVEVLIEES